MEEMKEENLEERDWRERWVGDGREMGGDERDESDESDEREKK